MSFDRCPICLSKNYGPFVGISAFAYSEDDFGVAAINVDGEPCCSIGDDFDNLADAEKAAAACDRLRIEADSRSEAAMYEDDGSYGPADSDPYDCDRYGY
jgi:hypothetical protein